MEKNNFNKISCHLEFDWHKGIDENLKHEIEFLIKKQLIFSWE